MSFYAHSKPLKLLSLDLIVDWRLVASGVDHLISESVLKGHSENLPEAMHLEGLQFAHIGF